jgi:hypothetical protein
MVLRNQNILFSVFLQIMMVCQAFGELMGVRTNGYIVLQIDMC